MEEKKGRKCISWKLFGLIRDDIPTAVKWALEDDTSDWKGVARAYRQRYDSFAELVYTRYCLVALSLFYIQGAKMTTTIGKPTPEQHTYGPTRWSPTTGFGMTGPIQTKGQIPTLEFVNNTLGINTGSIPHPMITDTFGLMEQQTFGPDTMAELEALDKLNMMANPNTMDGYGTMGGYDVIPPKTTGGFEKVKHLTDNGNYHWYYVAKDGP